MPCRHTIERRDRIIRIVRAIGELPAIRDTPVLAGLLADRRLLGGHRIALLTREGPQYGVGRALSARAEFEGTTIEVFTDAEAAARWLGPAPEPPAG